MSLRIDGDNCPAVLEEDGRRVPQVLAGFAVDDDPALRRGGEKAGWATGELFMAVRVATTGRAATPPLFETLVVLGKETCRRRLRRAAEALKAVTP